MQLFFNSRNTGPDHGFLITHGESISIADHLTLRENRAVVYRPTVHYAYQPCDDALLSMREMAGKNWQPQRKRWIIRDEIAAGVDELGVLLMGNAKGVLLVRLAPHHRAGAATRPYNNATSMQVAAGALAGMVCGHCAIRAPAWWSPDDLDYEAVLEIARPYLGEVVGVYGDWTPLRDREQHFSEELDRGDPWQFRNIRVT